MTIQFYPDELDWVNAKIAENPGSDSLLVNFCRTCLRADSENYEVLRPVVIHFMTKYPIRKTEHV